MRDTSGPPVLGELLDGFFGFYRPEMSERTEVYRSGIIVLDTNALLDVYRLSPRAREDLLNVLESIRDRLFVPHQVASEFHTRRVDAVVARLQELRAAADQLEKERTSAYSLVRHIARRAHGRSDRAEETEAKLDTAFDAAASLLKTVSDDYDLVAEKLAGSPPSSDALLTRLQAILSGRVASRPPADVLEEDRKEGRRRVAAGELPASRMRIRAPTRRVIIFGGQR